ncbi:hypothetical protein ACOMCU_01740 [Lysinibacillus sp. UGB7]|uniref:hypothetical protein n=1 Tax=Lysinibacillus sp. UGB7 TaxID=3411039 RepID=UPI003B7AE43B
MFYKCDCGTVVHLSRDKHRSDEIANLMCLDCLKKYKPNTYNVEYTIPPLRANYRMRVLASNEKSAIEAVQKCKGNVAIRARKIELIELH